MSNTHQNRLYHILYPNPSLIASQLCPEEFAKHYQIGTTRYYTGKLIFVEIDPDFRHEFLEIEKGLAGLIHHEDGRPKSTKFISCYRVLEHIDFDFMKDLYLTSPEGVCLKLPKAPKGDEEYSTGSDLNVYAEICPISILSLATFTPAQFGKYIVNPDNPKGCPKIFFTAFKFMEEEFLTQFAENPFIMPPIPGIHPSKLRDAILSIQKYRTTKPLKGLSLHCHINEISFKLIEHGFWFTCKDKYLFYPMPDISTIEKENYKFYRSM